MTKIQKIIASLQKLTADFAQADCAQDWFDLYTRCALALVDATSVQLEIVRTNDYSPALYAIADVKKALIESTNGSFHTLANSFKMKYFDAQICALLMQDVDGSESMADRAQDAAREANK